MSSPTKRYDCYYVDIKIYSAMIPDEKPQELTSFHLYFRAVGSLDQSKKVVSIFADLFSEVKIEGDLSGTGLDGHLIFDPSKTTQPYFLIPEVDSIAFKIPTKIPNFKTRSYFYKVDEVHYQRAWKSLPVDLDKLTISK